MATSQRRAVLNLYKLLLQESKKFTAYNFRMYAIRKVRDSFKTNQQLTDPEAIASAIKEAETNLGILKRQVVIFDLYKSEKLVIENNQ